MFFKKVFQKLKDKKEPKLADFDPEDEKEIFFYMYKMDRCQEKSKSYTPDIRRRTMSFDQKHGGTRWSPSFNLKNKTVSVN